MNARTTGRGRSTLIVLGGVLVLAGSIAAGAAMASRGDDAAPTPSNPPVASPLPSESPSTPPFSPLPPTADPTPEPTPDPTPEPTPDPTPKPTPEPTPKPTPKPTPEPSDDPGSDATPFQVDLNVIGDDDVSIEIYDRSDRVVAVKAGPLAEGASVDLDEVGVENVDADTLRVTWTDYAIDNDLTLFVYKTEAGFRFLLIRPEPTTDVDAMVTDRVLFLDFAQAVDADDVESFVQAGMDTPGPG